MSIDISASISAVPTVEVGTTNVPELAAPSSAAQAKFDSQDPTGNAVTSSSSGEEKGEGTEGMKELAGTATVFLNVQAFTLRQA